jgi:hypothetical protein
MRQRERAEAAPPASPEQRALDCEIDRMMRELMFPRFIIPEREDAEARGIAWLKSCLSPEQLADYDRTHSFVVIGGHTRHRYRICWGTSQNIIRIEMLEMGVSSLPSGCASARAACRSATSCCTRRSRSRVTSKPRCGLPAGRQYLCCPEITCIQTG